MGQFNNLRQILEQLTFPRVSGSKFERKAYEMVKIEVEKMDHRTETQEFTFSTFYSRILPKIFFTLTFILLLFFNTENYILMAITALGMFMTVLISINPKDSRLGKKLESQTLYTRLPSIKNGSNIPKNFLDELKKDSKHIFLFAHLDSKGQRLTITLRIISFRLWLYSYMLSCTIISLNNYVFQTFIFVFLIIIFLSINLTATTMILLNTTNNKSPGAIDNGSGVVVLLDILRHFTNDGIRLSNYDLWFVFTGAEECGTMGARHFLKIMRKVPEKENILIVNFDGIAKGVDYYSGLITPKKNREIYSKFQKIAEDIKFDFTHSNKVFGIRSDGLYLKNKGFGGFGFGDNRTYKYYHSQHDSIDKVNFEILEKLSRFVFKALVELDKIQL
ncbi:MAG: M20/M25/M40 family metallo-hydrolase [Candidatus Lokiarchaeota archaeon]|nr:M20/M25/M40 family metallo-hydrolase [Candidatus Lokiarchaeota archaeon]